MPPPSLSGRLSPAAAFRERAEARAILWRTGELALHDAVDVLQDDAVRIGLVAEIADSAAQAIMADAFAAQREPLHGMVPEPVGDMPERNAVAASTLEAAAYLLRLGDRERWHQFLAAHSATERAEILDHIQRKMGGKP